MPSKTKNQKPISFTKALVLVLVLGVVALVYSLKTFSPSPVTPNVNIVDNAPIDEQLETVKSPICDDLSIKTPDNCSKNPACIKKSISFLYQPTAPNQCKNSDCNAGTDGCYWKSTTITGLGYCDGVPLTCEGKNKSACTGIAGCEWFPLPPSVTKTCEGTYEANDGDPYLAYKWACIAKSSNTACTYNQPKGKSPRRINLVYTSNPNNTKVQKTIYRAVQCNKHSKCCYMEASGVCTDSGNKRMVIVAPGSSWTYSGEAENIVCAPL